MSPGSRFRPTRRTFLQAAAATLGAAPMVPSLVRAAGQPAPPPPHPPRVGSGDYQYEAHHNWGQLPDHIRWGETHGVTIDRDGLVYITHRSAAAEPMDAIVVFDGDGKFVRSFGREYHGGGHGLDLRREGGEDFLYVCDIQHRLVAKATLKGEQVWNRGYPPEPGVYDDESQFRPTNVAFAPDGGFFVADGYGSHYVHRYDAQARWLATWGGEGTEPGKFRTPHGLWWDDRAGRTAGLVVADRANARLQYFTADGKPTGICLGVSFPAHFDIRGPVLMCADLHARVTLFDAQNQVLVHLGYDPDWTRQVLADSMAMRNDPTRWQPGRFVHPHDACFDHDGNIYVVEWVPTGRVTKLKKL